MKVTVAATLANCVVWKQRLDDSFHGLALRQNVRVAFRRCTRSARQAVRCSSNVLSSVGWAAEGEEVTIRAGGITWAATSHSFATRVDTLNA